MENQKNGAVKLKVDLDPKTRHDAGLNIFSGVERRAQSLSRWAYDLKIGRYMKPGENLDVVKKFRSLLVIQTHQPANAGRNVVAELEIIIADAEFIVLAPRDDSPAAKTEAIELLESARPWIRYSSAKKNPKPRVGLCSS